MKRSAGKIFAPTILMIAAIWLGAASAWAATAPASGASPPASGASSSVSADSSLSSSAREAANAAVSGLNLQTEIPDAPAGTGRPGNNPREDHREYSPGSEPRDGQKGSSPHYGEPVRISGAVPEIVARLLLWVSVAVIVVVVVIAVRDNVRNSGRSRQLERRRPDAPEINAGETQALARMDLSQEEADDLARRGLFAEAMHVLLLRSVSEMRRRLDISIAASLTSREILGRVSLPPEGQSGFADIIGRVEVSYFGPYQPGADEYLACRRSFELLTVNLRREVAQ